MNTLTFNQYQSRTGNTAVYKEKIHSLLEGAMNVTEATGNFATRKQLEVVEDMLNLAYLGCGLGEVGEIQGKVKKIIRDSGGEITLEVRQKIGKELGDALWYISELCSRLGIRMEDVAWENLDKLSDRKERGVLEGSGDDR